MRSLYFAFALRITRANSCLKKFRQLVGEGWIFMKIKSLRCIQMLQLIRTIISIKKRHTKLVLEVIKRQPWIRVRDQKSNSIPTVSSKGCSCHASCAMYILIPRPCLGLKIFCQYPSHRIFGHMHEGLNAVEKITNYTVKLISTSWIF